MKMFVWSDHFSFLAVAQAESVAKAREAMLIEMGESGDGSCPERDKARQQIVSENPSIWYGTNAAFALTDSAEVREQEAFTQQLQQQLAAKTKELGRQKATITGLSAQLTDERHAREAVERANEQLRDELAKVRSLSLDAVERHSKLRLEAEAALALVRKERDLAREADKAAVAELLDYLREQRDFNAKWIPVHEAEGYPGAADRRREIVAQFNRWISMLTKFDEQQTAAAGGTHEAEKGRAQIIGDSA